MIRRQDKEFSFEFDDDDEKIQIENRNYSPEVKGTFIAKKLKKVTKILLGGIRSEKENEIILGARKKSNDADEFEISGSLQSESLVEQSKISKKFLNFGENEEIGNLKKKLKFVNLDKLGFVGKGNMVEMEDPMFVRPEFDPKNLKFFRMEGVISVSDFNESIPRIVQEESPMVQKEDKIFFDVYAIFKFFSGFTSKDEGKILGMVLDEEGDLDKVGKKIKTI